MPLDAIQQKAKTIIETAYKLRGQKDKKEQEKAQQYILSLAASITKDLEEEKKSIKK